MKLSKEKREELKALAAKAVQGPWEEEDGEVTALAGACHIGSVATVDDFPCVEDEDSDEVAERCEANAAFIAASRQTLPDALADLEEMEAKLEDAVKALERIRANLLPVADGRWCDWLGIRKDETALIDAALARLKS